MGGMTLLVEVHLPMSRGEFGEWPPLWVQAVEDLLLGLDLDDTLQVVDEGEQSGGSYVFSLAGAGEPELLEAASRVARLDGVPAGAYALVTGDGAGRRVELPV